MLSVRLANPGEETLYYDWTGITLSFSDSPRLRPLKAHVGGQTYEQEWVELPPGKTISVSIIYYGGDDFLEAYRQREFLHYTTGDILYTDSSVACSLPEFYAKSQGKYP